MADPSDPAYTGGFLCYPDADIDPDGFGIVGARGTHRASAQSAYARYYGYHFAQVSCLKRYIRHYTRQEAWDYANMPYATGGVTEPPAQWVPPEDTPAYQFVDPDHPDARPVWICES